MFSKWLKARALNLDCWIQIPALPSASCVTWGKYQNLSVPHLKNVYSYIVYTISSLKIYINIEYIIFYSKLIVSIL